MRSQNIWFTILILVLVIGTAGCGKKRRDAGAETLDGMPEADTASVDASATAEALPIIDETRPFEDSPQAPTPELNGSGDMATYTVKGGDTLMKIAFTIYGDIAQWKNIYGWNRDVLKKASQLEKGTQLKYEKPSTEAAVERNGDPYLIKNGDTLATIADDIYAKPSRWKKLWANNRGLIHNPNRIYAGFYLYYQITEQEKAQAEKIKASRGGTTLSSAPPAEVPSTTAEAAAAIPAPAPGADGADAGQGALKPSGLSALAAPRAPASEPATATPVLTK